MLSAKHQMQQYSLSDCLTGSPPSPAALLAHYAGGAELSEMTSYSCANTTPHIRVSQAFSVLIGALANDR